MSMYETRLSKLHRLFKNQYHHTEPSLVLDPYLFLGNCISAHDVNRLSKLGIRYILNVASRDVEVCPYYGKDYRTLQIDLRDDEQENILQVLEKAFAFIDEAKLNKCRVLVHCSHGQSRSPAIVIAYLMRTYNISLEQCLSHVIKARPCVSPNDGFLKQLILYDKLLMDRKGYLRNSHKIQSNATNGIHSIRSVDRDLVKIPVHHDQQQLSQFNGPPPLTKSQSNDQQLPLKTANFGDTIVNVSEQKSDVQVIPIQIPSKTQNVQRPSPNSPRQTITLKAARVPSRDDLYPAKRQCTSNAHLYGYVTPQVSITEYFPQIPFMHENRANYITEIYDKATNRFIPGYF
ncbi:unnamed protein product [Didymodactylos carnosus]|uniref:protein-tyrosine-phosphatase n=1 Tax=Didymodactylos carnosus TaxID=1234261 RepID=A0A8S2DZQ1_9BILA|nr:unnamed protein product [Didymodactylos carnosus]CAF3817419.1 unnamed protein product [Didymodactylos carnosus]